MAFTELTVQETLDTGTIIAFSAAAADGNTFRNDFGAVLRVVNAGAGDIDVTIAAQRNCNHGFRHDLVVTVTNDEVPVEIGPFDNSRFLNRDGLIEATYEDVTDVTVAATRPRIS